MGYVSMGTFSIETSVSSRDFLCLRLQRLRTSSDTVSRAAEQTKEPFHSRNTINYTPSICISYIHHCTCTSTPLSCSYTLGNVQIKSRSLKKNSASHPATMRRFTSLPSHVTISMSRPLETQMLSGTHWSIYTKTPPASLKKPQSCRGHAGLAKSSVPKKPSWCVHPAHTPVHQLQVSFVLVQF